jgi:glutamate-ammonia-ligase adenylyltransferase
MAALGMERWREATAESGDETLEAFAHAMMTDSQGRQVLEAIFGNSPYLTQLAIGDLAFTRDVLAGGPEAAVAQAMATVERLKAAAVDDIEFARWLRISKRRLAFAVALADIAGMWPLERIVTTLSDFADAALDCAARRLLRAAAAAGAFALSHPDTPETNSGLVILGMGKLGARELNYSSDIDLIVLYDPERIQTRDPDALQRHFVRLARNLVRLMDERTADGYVFRTDLRLRPDPGATPLALSTLAAETYYESLGQNWERAAMIKSRVVAGDRHAGIEFLSHLRPFVWRKNLDFAAIQDIHSIKRQINAHRGGGQIAVAGHNIKLGRGGIREIEFFAQTQQLIWGGREPRLRIAGTLPALAALVECGLVPPETAADLARAYVFLRQVEHRLQMINDEQTQTLPESDAGLLHLATFLGYPDAETFSADLLSHLRAVESHYARLFEDAPSLSAEGQIGGNLVFTGVEADPDTLTTLSALGFRQPETVHATVRGWHHGRYRAMRSTRAREVLTELMPALLQALAKTHNPDTAFVRFDRFLAGLPAGVQLFSMFHSNPHLLDFVAEIMGSAPRLAEHLSRRPSVLDSVLTPDFLNPPPSMTALADELERLLAPAAHIEEVLDVSRRWANDRRFQVGVQMLKGLLAPDAAARAFSAIAEVAIAALLPRVESEFAASHGRFAGAGMGVVAMGKLGGREMTPTSDLDLILIYDVPPGVDVSDGLRPLPPSQYFARLGQRLINAITSLTAEGRLYEVDMRLRPSGTKGPIATSLEAFVRYHDEAAWTWEHLALTRARVIAGPAPMRQAAEAAIRRVLTQPRDARLLVKDVAEMRARIAAEHPGDSPWDVKHLRGGLVDVEFVAQYLELRHACAHPEILSPNTREALLALNHAGLLDAEDTRLLVEALTFWQGVQSLIRLTMESEPRRGHESEFPDPLKRDLTQLAAAVDFPAVESKIAATAAAVHAVFMRLIERPAVKTSQPAPPDAAAASGTGKELPL